MNKSFRTLVFTLLVFHCSGVYAQWIGAKTYKQFPYFSFIDFIYYEDAFLMYRNGLFADTVNYGELYDADFNPISQTQAVSKNQSFTCFSRNPLYPFISMGIDDPNAVYVPFIEQRDKNLQLIKRFPVDQSLKKIFCSRILDDGSGYVVAGNTFLPTEIINQKHYFAKINYDGQQLWRREIKLDSSLFYYPSTPFLSQVAPDEFVYTVSVTTRKVPNDITTNQIIPILIRFKSDGTILFQGTKFEFVKYTYNYNVDTLQAADLNTIHHLNAALPDKGFAVLTQLDSNVVPNDTLVATGHFALMGYDSLNRHRWTNFFTYREDALRPYKMIQCKNKDIVLLDGIKDPLQTECTFGHRLSRFSPQGELKWSKVYNYLVDTLHDGTISYNRMYVNAFEELPDERLIVGGDYSYSFTADSFGFEPTILITDQNGCLTASQCDSSITINIQQINSVEDSPKTFHSIRIGTIAISPLPVYGDLTLHIYDKQTEENVQYKIYNTQGQLVLNSKLSLTEGDSKIQLPNLPPGNYSLSLILKDGKQYSSMFIKM